MSQKNSAGTNVALRVATAMQKMGIDGLPRNYELVYEVYAGANPDLVRDFMAIGKFKQQKALDEVGRKYLPHHHEAGVLARQTTVFRDEMSNFMSLLRQESSALDDYGRIISEAKTEIAYNAARNGRSALAGSVEALRMATEHQMSRTAEIVETVAAQSQTIEDIQKEMADFEAAKFADPLTGLGNMRAFNKALARVYANPDMPILCGLALGVVDETVFAGEPAAVMTELSTRHVGAIVGQMVTGTDVVARLDGSHFGFLFYTSDEVEIVRLVNLLRASVHNARFVHPKTGRAFGNLTMSFGLCMSGLVGNAEQLADAAGKALKAARAGGNRVAVHAVAGGEPVQKDWMIYRA